MKLSEYIEKNFAGSRVEFAEFIGKPKQRVNDMLKKKYIVVDNTVYSKRFELPEKQDQADLSQ